MLQAGGRVMPSHVTVCPLCSAHGKQQLLVSRLEIFWTSLGMAKVRAMIGLCLPRIIGRVGLSKQRSNYARSTFGQDSANFRWPAKWRRFFITSFRWHWTLGSMLHAVYSESVSITNFNAQLSILRLQTLFCFEYNSLNNVSKAPCRNIYRMQFCNVFVDRAIL